DGAMQMNNMAELITVAKYWRRWPNPKWICCVWNNEDLNQVTWEQRVMEGFPKFEATQQVPNVPYHRFAELIGLKGIYVDDPERVCSARDDALRACLPGLIEGKNHAALRWAPGFRSCSRSRPTRRCRRCRRTSRSSRRGSSWARSCRATPTKAA